MMIEVKDTIDDEACVERLRAAEPYAVDQATIVEMVADCALLDIIEDGRVVGALALRIEGKHAHLSAAASGGALAFMGLTVAESLLVRAGVETIGLCTRRPGMIRRLTAMGYRVQSCTLIKEAGHHGGRVE